MVLLTWPKVALALVPSAVMAAMQTTMIRASITAYSTAVGPSSRFRKLTTDEARREKNMAHSPAGIGIFGLRSDRNTRSPGLVHAGDHAAAQGRTPNP